MPVASNDAERSKNYTRITRTLDLRLPATTLEKWFYCFITLTYHLPGHELSTR
jgi:hypothetical protein